jgi:hypothetical protein
MGISDTVYNDNYAPTASRTGLSKAFEKPMVRHGVEPFLLSPEKQFSIAQTDSAKVTHAPTRRMVQQDRVLLLRGDPHKTTRSIWLKMNLIRCPQIGSRINHDVSDFFICRLRFRIGPGDQRARFAPTKAKGYTYLPETICINNMIMRLHMTILQKNELRDFLRDHHL